MVLRIALATPWGKIRCGIKTYSEALTKALTSLGVEVYIVQVPRHGRKNASLFRNVAEKVPFDEVDIVHCQHEYCIWQGFEFPFYKVLARSGKPLVTTMHSVGNEVDRLIAGFSNKVIVHNEFCRKHFPFPNTVIIPHGAEINVKVPSVGEAKRFWGISLNTPVVGYLGFISSHKGLEDLIEAMIGVKADLIIGGGWYVEQKTPYIEKLKRVSEKLLKGKVQWLGFIPEERLALAYACMDVFVYPSRWAMESGALIKALSHGRCVIARNLPPFKEKERQGALVTFKSKKDLARKIRLMLENDEERHKLEQGARAYAESVSWNKVAKSHLRLYEDLVRGG